MLRRRQKKSRLRRLADSQELDYFILLAIAFNCVTMAFPPRMVQSQDDPTDFFCLADFVLNCIFVAEFLIKFAAWGLEYFADSWNLLDFVVVLQGAFALLSECPNERSRVSLPLGDISALRMVRILRPLKSLRKFPEMRLLVASLFGSFNLLLAILVLLGMAIFILAVFANFYFGDALDYRCLPDPYYDPFSGTFAANPTPFRNLTLQDAVGANRTNQYWSSEDRYDAYDDLLQKDRKERKRQQEFLATNFWKSLSLYRDYARDAAPISTQFPYFASFCGGCKTCRKCERCYSDNPADGCDLTISGDFFRKYGDPKRIAGEFAGTDVHSGDPASLPFTAITRTKGVVSQPRFVNQVLGVPVLHNDSAPELAATSYASWGLKNVTFVREYCVDLKRGKTEQVIEDFDPETLDADEADQRFSLASPGRAILDVGWQILTRYASRLNLKDPQYETTRLRFRIANCEENRKRAKKAFQVLPSEFYPRPMNARNCRKHYASKTGELRFSMFGKARPRKARFLWYHRFDATFWSMLTIFDVMNMENWQDALWSVQDAVGKYVWPFFYAVVGIVNICLLNLFPAVMSFNLRKGIREEENRNALDAKNKFMGTEFHQLTQFEEHMIDILAAEEEEVQNVRTFVWGAGSSSSSSSSSGGSAAAEMTGPGGAPLAAATAAAASSPRQTSRKSRTVQAETAEPTIFARAMPRRSTA
mmetsp:Transcript_8081/g.26538  ORF Transcript_8081/g.26538 Transcript_8081/m.26538 type:complete len:705 (-) Transcript_8081:969-3083(-)